ncbi:hypothetical protein [Moraxella caprae]|nr:hypothetical protein [Moraxella caprae]
MKNACLKKSRGIARFSRKKLEVDGHSIKQVFNFEPQDLAIFHAKID